MLVSSLNTNLKMFSRTKLSSHTLQMYFNRDASKPRYALLAAICASFHPITPIE